MQTLFITLSFLPLFAPGGGGSLFSHDFFLEFNQRKRTAATWRFLVVMKSAPMTQPPPSGASAGAGSRLGRVSGRGGPGPAGCREPQRRCGHERMFGKPQPWRAAAHGSLTQGVGGGPPPLPAETLLELRSKPFPRLCATSPSGCFCGGGRGGRILRRRFTWGRCCPAKLHVGWTCTEKTLRQSVRRVCPVLDIGPGVPLPSPVSAPPEFRAFTLCC